MIIGLSGYIGSGKDTVGEMIKELDSWWEDDVGPFPRHMSKAGWEIKKFAGKLKEIASLLTGIPKYKFEDQDFKNTTLGDEWDNISVRKFLQRLGTEAIRNNIHTEAWVNALFADYIGKAVGGWPEYGMTEDGKRIPIGYNSILEYPNWIITDVRFPNEAQAVKDRGGVVVRVERRRFEDAPYQTLEQRHSSETSLDSWVFDYTIDNDGTLEDLREKVKDFMGNINKKSVGS